MDKKLVFDILDKNASSFNEEKLFLFVEPLTLSMKEYLKSLSKKSYNLIDSLSIASFEAEAAEKIKQVLCNYFIKFEHWRQNRKFEPYLKSALINHAKFLRNKNSSVNLQQKFICPLCKEDKQKNILSKEEDLWRCEFCTDEVKKILSLQLPINQNTNLILKLRSIYALHSRRGYFCLDCGRFLPTSSCNGDIISCPFLDCCFSDSIFNLEETYNHPSTTIIQKELSYDNFNKNYNADLADKSLAFKTDDIFSNPEDNILSSEILEEDFKLIKRVVDEQCKKIKRSGLSTTIQKLSMYEAFLSILNSVPHEMIPYLVEQKRSSLPLQSFIFQKYVQILENKLPFNLGKKEIFDILDPELNLFLGISKFSAVVENNRIPNHTKENYIGGRKGLNHGPCYFGKILEIKNLESNLSILDRINYFSFSEIVLNTRDFHSKKVEVTHMRIPSHYEMGNLVFLQRIRKDIVEKIKFYKSK